MEWNGIYVNEYRPGAVEWVGRGVGRIFWILFYLSPYAFFPYLVYRWLDNTPAPWPYVVLIASIGAVGVYYAVQFGFTRLIRWKKTGGGFLASLATGVAILVFFALRVWAVEAGSARAMRSWKGGPEFAYIFAAVFALFVLNLSVKQQFYRRR
jgi:hypothetical protein